MVIVEPPDAELFDVTEVPDTEVFDFAAERGACTILPRSSSDVSPSGQ
jgi:hypothetical protein